MQVEVLLFAAVREQAGTECLRLELPDRACADDVIRAIGRAIPSVKPLLPSCRVAIDSCYVSGDASVTVDNEIALIPPVSGG